MKRSIFHIILILMLVVPFVSQAQTASAVPGLDPLPKDDAKDEQVLNKKVLYRLVEGVNLLSFPVIPENASCDSVFETLVALDLLVKVQDEKGQSYELFPMTGAWRNEIGEISSRQAYRVVVAANCTFKLEGKEETSLEAWPLAKGWNLMPYVGKEDQSALILMSDLIKKGTLIQVKDDRGNSLEKDPNGTWINSIGNFKPNKAYEVKVSRKCEVAF